VLPKAGECPADTVPPMDAADYRGTGAGQHGSDRGNLGLTLKRIPSSLSSHSNASSSSSPNALSLHPLSARFPCLASRNSESSGPVTVPLEPADPCEETVLLESVRGSCGKSNWNGCSCVGVGVIIIGQNYDVVSYGFTKREGDVLFRVRGVFRGEAYEATTSHLPIHHHYTTEYLYRKMKPGT
jgi:hypothetical protein